MAFNAEYRPIINLGRSYRQDREGLNTLKDKKTGEVLYILGSRYSNGLCLRFYLTKIKISQMNLARETMNGVLLEDSNVFKRKIENIKLEIDPTSLGTHMVH